MSPAMEPAKRPGRALLAGPDGHPTHPILVTIPIGAWVASLVFDIASHVVAHPGFLRQGAQWLIAIGIIGALAAAAIGLLDLLAIARGTKAFRTGLLHMSLNLSVTVAFVINFFWRNSSYGHAGAVPVGQLVLSLVSLLALGVSGYLGGKLAYRYGVRVADQATQAEGYLPAHSAQGSSAGDTARPLRDTP